ncbi:MAG TPA: ATP-binding protein [Anaeromyxobacteraceae bacterium]|nr:ATP-binding protein [Anaeromyxobacteraceae bacterium]
MRRVSTRIFLAFAAALVAFGGVAAFGVSRLHDLGRQLRLLSEGYFPLTRVVAQIDVKDWVTSRALEVRALDPAARRAWLPVARAHFPTVREKIAEGREVLERARPLAGEADARFLGEVASRLDALDARWSQYDASSRALFDALERGEAPPAELEARVQAVRTEEKGLSLEVKLLAVKLEAQISDRVHAAERAESRTVAAIVIYTLLAVAVGFAALLVAQRLLAPIRTLTEGVKAVAAGDLSRQVEVRSRDEIGALAREFNAMAASLARQQSELLRAERLAAVGRIASQITHEIRNPLNAISLNAELLAEELGPGAAGEAPALLRAIGREIDRLNAVVEEYLRFARLPKPQKAREDLNEILSGLLDFIAPEMAAALVEVRRDLGPDLPPVMADEGQLRSAFLNLLRNAREATPGGGVVTVSTRSAEGGVEAEVRDTGAGIPEEVLPRIFDPFYSTKERGTGLGLAFALQVAEEHGGSLRCQSRPGQGTVFVLRLPAGEAAAAPRREVARA